jgi:HK97 family phage major capsid protein
MPGSRPDARLFNAALPSGMSETVPQDGGFAVPIQYGTGLMEKTYSTGEILQRVKRQPITVGNTLKIPAIDETSRADGSRMGGVSAYWVEEGGSITASAPKFRHQTLSLRKLSILVLVTEELLADAVALESYLMSRLPTELTFRIEDAIVNGDGAGKPLGWKSGNAVVSVAKETNQAAATFNFKNALKMWSRMWAPSRANAVWLINQDVEPELYSMSVAVGTGGAPVFVPGGGASAQPYTTLMGRPVIPAEYCATLGTVGDVQLVDPTQYTLADKGGVQAASSMHVYFSTDEMAFRWVVRVDGQPDWSSALTPKNGSNTLSPFVTLATRA